MHITVISQIIETLYAMTNHVHAFHCKKIVCPNLLYIINLITMCLVNKGMCVNVKRERERERERVTW